MDQGFIEKHISYLVVLRLDGPQVGSEGFKTDRSSVFALVAQGDLQESGDLAAQQTT